MLPKASLGSTPMPCSLQVYNCRQVKQAACIASKRAKHLHVKFPACPYVQQASVTTLL
jgi:hypothetical protein